jgi:hypothetical protein
MASIAGLIPEAYTKLSLKLESLMMFLLNNQGMVVAIVASVPLIVTYSKYRKVIDKLNAVKKVKTVSSLNNHKHSHILRDSIFELYALDSDVSVMIQSKITSVDNISAGEAEIQEYVFNKIEKITCDYCCHIATSLKKTIDATICCLGYL